jgi:hypothetical protein
MFERVPDRRLVALADGLQCDLSDVSRSSQRFAQDVDWVLILGHIFPQAGLQSVSIFVQ